jgi:hypothetical protein
MQIKHIRAFINALSFILLINSKYPVGQEGTGQVQFPLATLLAKESH